MKRPEPEHSRLYIPAAIVVMRDADETMSRIEVYARIRYYELPSTDLADKNLAGGGPLPRIVCNDDVLDIELFPGCHCERTHE